jgi:hypothetical protein
MNSTGSDHLSGQYSQHEQYNGASEHNGWNGNQTSSNNGVNDNGMNNSGTMNRGNNRFANNQNRNEQTGQGITYDTQQKIRQSLENNGFKNVKVMPEAFLVRAQAPDGSRIVMEISPDQATGVIMNTGSSTNRNDNQGTNQSGSSANEWNSDHNSSSGYNGGTGIDHSGLNR